MNPSGPGTGGWVLMMYLMRAPTGTNVFPLDVTGAVGTIPHSNPYTVGTGQAKEDNQVIAALQGVTGGKYNWMMDNYQVSATTS